MFHGIYKLNQSIKKMKNVLVTFSKLIQKQNYSLVSVVHMDIKILTHVRISIKSGVQRKIKMPHPVGLHSRMS